MNFRRAEIVHKPLGGARKSFRIMRLLGIILILVIQSMGVFEVQTRQGYKARFVPGMYNCVYVGSQIAFSAGLWVLG